MMAYNELDMLPARAFRARFGRLETLEGGKDSPAPPDYTPVAAASKEAAEIGAQLGREQLAENRRQYEQNMAVARPIIEAQSGLMTQSIEQGDDYFNYMKNTFRPLEGQMVADARSAGGQAEQDAASGKAAADVTQSFGAQRGLMTREMSRAGVDPSSGRFAAVIRDMGTQEALAKAGAMTKAREGAKALGYAKRMDAIGVGRNLPSASQGAYGLALQSGNSAVGNQNQTAAQYINGMAAGNSTIMQGQGQRLQGLGSILNSQTSVYNASQGGSSGLGEAGSFLGGAAAVRKAFSDRRLKENIVHVGHGPYGLPVYEFNYIGQAQRYRGVMADEVEQVMPEAVVVGDDGFKQVNYGMLGMQMVEV